MVATHFLTITRVYQSLSQEVKWGVAQHKKLELEKNLMWHTSKVWKHATTDQMVCIDY